MRSCVNLQHVDFGLPEKTSDSIPIRFVDEQYTGEIKGPEVFISPEWWKEMFGGSGATWAEFVASPCHTFSTTVGIVTGLLPKPEREEQ